jgi:hypothetical protein
MWVQFVVVSCVAGLVLFHAIDCIGQWVGSSPSAGVKLGDAGADGALLHKQIAYSFVLWQYRNTESCVH